MELNCSLPISDTSECVQRANRHFYKVHLSDTETVREAKMSSNQRHKNDKLSNIAWLLLIKWSLGVFRINSPVKAMASTLNTQSEASSQSRLEKKHLGITKSKSNKIRIGALV